jgi:hypothetical protein
MMTNSLATLPLAQLKQAVFIREQIESLQSELSQLLGSPASASTNGATSNHKHSLSVAGRERIAAAQRLRWSKYNGSSKTGLNAVSGNQRLSAAGRAKVSAAVTARWARYRAAKAKALKAS